MQRDSSDGTSWNLEEAFVSHAYSSRLAYLLLQVLPKDAPVVDYGCGPGMYVAYLRARGYRALGIEGTKDINEIGMVTDIRVADLSKPLPPDVVGPEWVGNAISFEVGEHIDPASEDIFLDSLTARCSGRIVLSWAIPNQGGHGHVNEQPNQHIVEQMAKRGFAINIQTSNFLRMSLAEDPAWWFRNTLMVFDKTASTTTA